MEIKVTTNISDGCITQHDEVIGDTYGLQDLAHRHTQRVMNLREEGVKDALAKLGYLDPSQSKELLQSLDKLCYAYRRVTGLDGAWDSELAGAQNLLEKYKEKLNETK